jgi:hypothetical protein
LVTLQEENLHGVSIFKTHSVTDKADGQRKLLFVCDDKVYYIVGNSLQEAQKYGQPYPNNSEACGVAGGPWTNQVYAAPLNQMPNYEMSSTELSCYSQNNPDLAANGIVNNTQLQQHWNTYGANQSRNNQAHKRREDDLRRIYKGVIRGDYDRT